MVISLRSSAAEKGAAPFHAADSPNTPSIVEATKSPAASGTPQGHSGYFCYVQRSVSFQLQEGDSTNILLLYFTMLMLLIHLHPA